MKGFINVILLDERARVLCEMESSIDIDDRLNLGTAIALCQNEAADLIAMFNPYSFVLHFRIVKDDGTEVWNE